MRVISGLARGVQLRTPDGTKTRPTADRVKEAMFSIIQFDIPCAKVLDLFGGLLRTRGGETPPREL